MTEQHDLATRVEQLFEADPFQVTLVRGDLDLAAAMDLRACIERIEALESRQRVLREALTTIGHSLVCAPTDYAEHNARALLEAGNIARAALEHQEGK